MRASESLVRVLIDTWNWVSASNEACNCESSESLECRYLENRLFVELYGGSFCLSLRRLNLLGECVNLEPGVELVFETRESYVSSHLCGGFGGP